MNHNFFLRCFITSLKSLLKTTKFPYNFDKLCLRTVNNVQIDRELRRQETDKKILFIDFHDKQANMLSQMDVRKYTHLPTHKIGIKLSHISIQRVLDHTAFWLTITI